MTPCVAGYARERAADSITAGTPSSWHANTNSGAVVFITAAPFITTLSSLASARATQYGSATIVDVQSIYNEFNTDNFGSKSPQAIQTFLRTAQNWKHPPQYVVLVGQGTDDPRNYVGFGNNDFVPPRIIFTQALQTSSDDFYTDFNGDGIADVPIGRIPVRTAAELAVIVAKLQNFARAPVDPTWVNKATFVADALLPTDDPAPTFDASSAQAQALLPRSFSVNSISVTGEGSASARTALLNQLNAGCGLLFYFGHASEASWSDPGAPILLSTDPPFGNSPRLPLITALTCFDGAFQDIFQDCLATTFIKDSGGPVAMIASSGFVDSTPEFAMGDVLIRALFSPAAPSFGQSLLAAKKTVTDSDVRRTYMLFGDPSMHLK